MKESGQLERIKLLEKQVEQSNVALNRLEVTCYETCNRPIPFSSKTIEQYNQMKAEEAELLQLYNKKSGDITQLYHKVRKVHLNEKKSTLNMIKSIQSKLDLVKCQSAEEEKEGKENLKSQFNKMKDELQKIREMNIGFKVVILENLANAHTTCAKLIEAKKKKADQIIEEKNATLENLKQQKNSILERHENQMSLCSLNINVESNDVNPPSDSLQNAISPIVEAGKQFLQKIHQYSCNLKPLLDKLNILERRIEQIKEKVDACIDKFKEINAVIVSKNFASQVKGYLRFKRMQWAMSEYQTDLLADKDEVLKRLEEEYEIVNRKIPGTDITVLEMRRQIAQLSKEISAETIQKNDILRNLETEYNEFVKASDDEIRQLESQINNS